MSRRQSTEPPLRGKVWQASARGARRPRRPSRGSRWPHPSARAGLSTVHANVANLTFTAALWSPPASPHQHPTARASETALIWWPKLIG